MAARISPTNPRPEINTRQELFCRLIAEGRSQYESYTDAGYKATTRGVADAEACKLLKAPKIVARVKEIQAENALAARISVASVTKMYLAIYDKAMANDDLGPATAAVTGVAKLHGLVIDRAQIEAVIRKPSFDPNAEETMSESAWFEQFGSKIAIDYQEKPQVEEVYPVDARPRGGARDDDGGNGKIIDMYADDD